MTAGHRRPVTILAIESSEIERDLASTAIFDIPPLTVFDLHFLIASRTKNWIVIVLYLEVSYLRIIDAASLDDFIEISGSFG